MDHTSLCSHKPEHPDRFITSAEVQTQTSLSRATIWRLIRAKKFPRSYQLSPGRKGWRQKEVDTWIASRVADRAETGGR